MKLASTFVTFNHGQQTEEERNQASVIGGGKEGGGGGRRWVCWGESRNLWNDHREQHTHLKYILNVIIAADFKSKLQKHRYSWSLI